MTKINREEYEVLKELVDKYKWISRDGNNISELIKEYEYHNEPVKLAGGLSITQAKYDKYLEEHIKELENEREETEVKDIEWLKKEFDDLFNGKSILTVGRSVVDEILNQLDESEVKRLEKKIKELESFNDELIRDNNQLRNELDSQEVLSSDWIDEYSNGPSRSQYVWVDDLKELLVPKQEDMFNGETPEEEQKYRVLDNTDVHLLCKFEGEVITVAEFIEFSDISDVLRTEQYNLTEKEIKDYDPRYMAFAKPIEVLEE